jgi:uncharacterized protein (DUF885 family)
MSAKTIKTSTKSVIAKRPARLELSEADVDAFVAEHRDALNESIKRARADVKKGIHSPRSVKEIAAAGLKKLRSKSGRTATR